jgi:aspartate oxidase
MPKSVSSDFLIIGSGIAGLSLALKASRHGTVRLVTKRQLSESATDYAQGGLAAVFSREDSDRSPRARYTGGRGRVVGRKNCARKVVSQAPARIQDLIDWGVRFTASRRSVDAEHPPYQLGLEGGHSRRRILHVGDYTGHAVEQVLVDRVRQNPRIVVHEFHAAVDLLTRRRLGKKGGTGDACGGAYVLDVESGAVRTFLARATALATGGAGKNLSLHVQPRHRHGRRYGHGVSRRGAVGEHGIRPIPSHVFVPSQSQKLFDQRSPAGGRGGFEKTARASGSPKNTIPAASWRPGTSWPGPSTPN